MSINWVMLSRPEGFTLLDGEQRLWKSSPRTAISLDSAIKYPGKQPFSLQSNGGCLHLTNRRIVYLPSTSTPQFQSFASPLLYLHDTHVTAPWFGPNIWVATLQPVANGGIPSHIHAVELKITFKDGGAYDFSTKFERVKERLQQAVSVAQEDGTRAGAAGGVGNTNGVNLNNVNLDELPAYSESARMRHVDAGSQPVAQAPDPVLGNSQRHTQLGVAMGLSGPAAASTSTVVDHAQTDVFTPPAEPPPGYEELPSRNADDGNGKGKE